MSTWPAPKASSHRLAIICSAALVALMVGGCGVTVTPPSDESCDEGVACGDRCVDISSDPEHCGGCDDACPPDQLCEDGECVDVVTDCREVPCTGFTYCDLDTGECLPGCASDGQCGAGGVCDFDTRECVCVGDLDRCGTSCVDTSSDRYHCGGCHAPCEAHEACEDGVCVQRCPTGQTYCAGECIEDLSENPEHCGACGVTCRADQYCEGGRCEDICPGATLCGTECVDTTSDPENCGDCGVVCGSDEICAGGTCASSCGDGWIVCGGRCVDASSDDEHCGGCGNACLPNESCIDSTCTVTSCEGGLTMCGDVCVDTRSDPKHCGGCDSPCKAEETCVGGDCQGEPAHCLDYVGSEHMKACDTDTQCDSPLQCHTVSSFIIETDKRCAHRTPCGDSPTNVCCRFGHYCGKSDGTLADAQLICCEPGEWLGGLFATCQDAGATLGCRTSSDCPNQWGRPHCDTSRANPVCVPCSEDSHCRGGLYCDPDSGSCVTCATDAHCPSAEASYCAPDKSRCVECSDHAHCTSAAEPACSSTTYTCVECATAEHCTDPDRPGCSYGACVECTSDAHCDDEAMPRCRTVVNECAECALNSHCPTALPFCVQGTCEECPSDTACTTLSDGRNGCYPTSPPDGHSCEDDDECGYNRICGGPDGEYRRCVRSCP